jgi:hypothetical protein
MHYTFSCFLSLSLSFKKGDFMPDPTSTSNYQPYRSNPLRSPIDDPQEYSPRDADPYATVPQSEGWNLANRLSSSSPSVNLCGGSSSNYPDRRRSPFPQQSPVANTSVISADQIKRQRVDITSIRFDLERLERNLERSQFSKDIKKEYKDAIDTVMQSEALNLENISKNIAEEIKQAKDNYLTINAAWIILGKLERLARYVEKSKLPQEIKKNQKAAIDTVIDSLSFQNPFENMKKKIKNAEASYLDIKNVLRLLGLDLDQGSA